MSFPPLHAAAIRHLPWIALLSMGGTMGGRAQIPDTWVHTLGSQGGAQQGGGLGAVVAVAGELAVVSAPEDDTAGDNAGAVKIFDVTSGGLRHVLLSPNATAGGNFGSSLAVSGRLLVVGAPGEKAGPDETPVGRAYIYDLLSQNPASPVRILNSPRMVLWANFGGSVAISGTNVVVWAPGVPNASGMGIAYVFRADGSSSQASATLSKPTPYGGSYGPQRVALHGNLVVLGDPADESDPRAPGKIHIFDLERSNPSLPVATIGNPGSGGGGDFGRSVAMDGAWLVVGAPGNYDGQESAGQVFVFDFSQSIPAAPVFTIQNQEPQKTPAFGTGVAIRGRRVAIGATGLIGFSGGTGGRIFVHDLEQDEPTVPVAILSNPGTKASDRLGATVALLNSQLIAGASGDDSDGLDAGRAYVYHPDSATPSIPTTILSSVGSSAGDGFGRALAVAGNWLVVGAPEINAQASPRENVGRVFVYLTREWQPNELHLTLEHPSGASKRWTEFGSAVAVAGNRVVVGSLGSDNDFEAHVFDLKSPSPTIPAFTLKRGTVSNGRQFGRAVAISGPRVAIGDPTGSLVEREGGTVSVFNLTSEFPSQSILTLANPVNRFQHAFGQHLALAAGILVVGDPLADTAANDSGTVFVYDLDGSAPSQPMVVIPNPTPAPADEFGQVVATDGRWVVVGAPLDDQGGSNAGVVHVYYLHGLNPAAPQFTLRKPSPQANDRFGCAVVLSGGIVAVGACDDDTGTTDAGSVFLYDLESATPQTPVAHLPNPTPGQQDRFGATLAWDGGWLAAGAPDDDLGAIDKGAVHLYRSKDADADGLPDAWELAQWGTTARHEGGGDSDGDGYVELLELALGLNPKVPDPGGLPSVEIEDGFLTLNLIKQPGATYQVETGGSLAPGVPGSFSSNSVIVITDTTTHLKARDHVPIGESPARFIRLRVRANPR